MLKLLKSNVRVIPYLPIIVDVISRPKESEGAYPFKGCLDSITAKNFDLNDFIAFINDNQDIIEDYNEEKSNGRTPAQYAYNIFFQYFNKSKDNARVKLSLILDSVVANSEDEEDVSTTAENEEVIQENRINVRFQLIKLIKIIGALTAIYKLDIFNIINSYIREPRFKKDNYYYDLSETINNGSVKLIAFQKTKNTVVDHALFQRREEYSSLCRQLRRKSETFLYNGKYLKNICIWLDKIANLVNEFNLVWDIESFYDSRIVQAGITLTEEDLNYKELYVDFDELLYNAEDSLVSITNNILDGDINIGPFNQSIVRECIAEKEIPKLLQMFCPDYFEDSVISYNSNDTVMVDDKIAILAINDDFKRDSHTGRLLQISRMKPNNREEFSVVTQRCLLSGSFAIINRNGIIYSQLVNSKVEWCILDQVVLNSGIIKKPIVYSEE